MNLAARMHTATIITIGDELLIGQTIDTNSAWIAQQLNALGMLVRRRIAIADRRDDILDTLREELAGADLLIVTGGLGPTKDDITKEALLAFFGGAMRTDEATLTQVRAIFAKRNRPMLDVNLRQADVPDSCEVLTNAMGTAPGMWFEQNGKVAVSLPGVPYEMIHIMEAVALPKLRARFTEGVVVHRTILTAGEGESFIAHQIEDLEDALPSHIKLAFLPSPGMVRLRLTATGMDEIKLAKEVEMRQEEIANRLEKIVVALEDLPLEHILGKTLAGKGLTLGLAESCTGGYIAHKITQIMGSATYFQGSVVCYQESVKHDLLHVKHKTMEACYVVSEEVALEMAHGARKALKSDIGFGITGLLSGGDTDRVPVGTVCMAVTNGKEETIKTFHFQMDRVRNKELAMQHGLLMIWRFVSGMRDEG